MSSAYVLTRTTPKTPLLTVVVQLLLVRKKLPSSGRCLPSHYLATGLRATVPICHTSRDSVVGIATGYGLNGRGVGVRVPIGVRFFSSPRRPGWF
jgi:hypothetical protein